MAQVRIRTNDGLEWTVRRRLVCDRVITTDGKALPIASITHVQTQHLVRTKKGRLTLRRCWCRIDRALSAKGGAK